MKLAMLGIVPICQTEDGSTIGVGKDVKQEQYCVWHEEHIFFTKSPLEAWSRFLTALGRRSEQ